MAFTYCKSCGYKNMYTLSAPKFCGGCGSELSGSGVAKASKPERAPAERGGVEDFDPDGLDIFTKNI